MFIAKLILTLVGGYAAVGLLFAIVFSAFGVARLDSAARGSGFVFRLMIVPGCAALWPLVAMKWMHRGSKGGEPTDIGATGGDVQKERPT